MFGRRKTRRSTIQTVKKSEGNASSWWPFNFKEYSTELLNDYGGVTPSETPQTPQTRRQLPQSLPSKQTITIFVILHGSDMISEPNNLKTSPIIINRIKDITHTAVSFIGRLGCLNYYNNTLYKIKNYQQMYKDKNIVIGNKLLQDTMKAPHKHTILQGVSDHKYINTDEKFYYQTKNYADSAFEERSYLYDREYSKDPKITATDIGYGIYVLETTNIKNPKLQEIFDRLKNFEDISQSCIPVDKTIANSVMGKKIAENCFSVENNILNLYNIKQFANAIADSNYKDIMNTSDPKFSIFNNTFDNLFNTDNKKYTNILEDYFIEPITEQDKEWEITKCFLSQLLAFFNLLGFEHVNIVDASCRGEYEYPIITNSEREQFRRQVSSNEKILAQQIKDENKYEEDGIEKSVIGGNTKSKNKRNRKNRKSKNKRNRKSKNKRSRKSMK